jgi:preprotein translocase subunit SecA
MALNLTDVVLRPFNYCIIDEVDSILIDEAQTPLIISNNIQTPIEKYIVAAEITDYLELNIHYKVDEKNKNVVLTEEGSKQIEKILSIQDLYDPKIHGFHILLMHLKQMLCSLIMFIILFKIIEYYC